MKNWIMHIGLGCAVAIMATPGWCDEAPVSEDSQNTYEQDADYMVRPGLLANRAERWVKIDAQATGIKDSSPIEFFVVYKKSGHDYESLFISQAEPLDIHRALEFIGCAAGHPVQYSKLHFWPKGERIMVRVEWEVTGTDGKLKTPSLPLEELIYDSRRKGPLPASGFVFTGSLWMTNPESGTQSVYAASASDPYSIICDYNEARSVLDVPFQRPDSEVYGTQTAFEDHLFEKGQAVRLIFTPESRTEPRIQNLLLTISPDTTSGANGLENLRFNLTNDAGVSLTKKGELKHFLSALRGFQKRDQDPFISLSWADNLSLGDAHTAARLLKEISGDKGIRMDAPPANQLFYKAFLPDESLRQRSRRPSQPLELHISKSDEGVVSANLVQITEQWEEGVATPTLTDHTTPLKDPKQVPALLAKRPLYQRALLVFAPPDLSYGELWPFLSEVNQTESTIHIYLQEDKEQP